jgi:hypothetical protein
MSACVPGVRFESKQAITGSTHGFRERHKVLRARSSALVGGFWKGLGPQKYRDDGMYTGAVSLKFLLLSLVVWLKRILWRRDLVCRRGNLPYPWGRCLCGYYNCETLMRVHLIQSPASTVQAFWVYSTCGRKFVRAGEERPSGASREFLGRVSRASYRFVLQLVEWMDRIHPNSFIQRSEGFPHPCPLNDSIIGLVVMDNFLARSSFGQTTT